MPADRCYVLGFLMITSITTLVRFAVWQGLSLRPYGLSVKFTIIVVSTSTGSPFNNVGR